MYRSTVVHRLLEILSNCLLPTKYDGPFTDVLPSSSAFCRRKDVMHKSLFISVERAQNSWIQVQKSKWLNHTVWKCTLFSLLHPNLAFDSPLFSMFGFCLWYWGCTLYFAFDALFAIAIGKFLDCFSSVLFDHEVLRSTCVVVPAIEHMEFWLASAKVQQFFSEAVRSTSKTFLRFRFSTIELPEQEIYFYTDCLVEVDTHTHTEGELTNNMSYPSGSLAVQRLFW